MKVYVGNYDGRREAMVAAQNQREAAAAVGVSLYEFRNYYGLAPDDVSADLALESPGVVFVRPMMSRSVEEWVKLRN